ncbi:IS110 family transposase [Neisseriaceae bacterium B1]
MCLPQQSVRKQSNSCLKMLEWIRKNITTDLSTVHVIMEATGVYHELLAYFLHDQGITVSIVNPAYSQLC